MVRTIDHVLFRPRINQHSEGSTILWKSLQIAHVTFYFYKCVYIYTRASGLLRYISDYIFKSESIF